MRTAFAVAFSTVQVSALATLSPLHLRIDSTWYDLRRWRLAHPSGPHWIDGFADRDATEVFHAFHSTEAAAMLPRLPLAQTTPPSIPPPTPLTLAFRKLRSKLIDDGWYDRVWHEEARIMAPCVALFVAGTAVARTIPLLATILLALGSSAAGWIGHDYIHGRGKLCNALRGWGAIFNGHSATWWSQKHNLHHALTNVVGCDEDIMSDPFFFLWPPDPANDNLGMRKKQHILAPVTYSILFALWRFNSLKTVHNLNLYKSEGWLIGLNYLWMACFLPLSVAISHVFLAGLITATIVTVSHQTEELLAEPDDDWVRGQMLTTRDAVTSNFFSEWLWGGMQYQLEHHLFPTMPRYRYPKLAPLVKQLAEDHGIEYRQDGELEIVMRNWRALRDIASAPAVPGALATRRDTVWSRRAGAAWTGAGARPDEEEDTEAADAVATRAPAPQMRMLAAESPRRRSSLLRMLALVAAAAGAAPATAECDDACKQRIADRRKLFEQSRTTNDRQVIFDLSKQRAKLYNTTYQGANCIPGLPCI